MLRSDRVQELAGGEKAARAEQGRPLVQDHQEGHGVHEAEEPQEEEPGEPVGRRVSHRRDSVYKQGEPLLTPIGRSLWP